MNNKILIASLLLISVSVKAQITTHTAINVITFSSNDSAQRYYIIDKNDSFLIEYNINTSTYFEPAVGRFKTIDGKMVEDTAAYRVNRHYDAIITVYRMKNGIMHKVGNSFSGTYVPSGCFEDVPEYEVKKALSLETKKLPDEVFPFVVPSGTFIRPN